MFVLFALLLLVSQNFDQFSIKMPGSRVRGQFHLYRSVPSKSWHGDLVTGGYYHWIRLNPCIHNEIQPSFMKLRCLFHSTFYVRSFRAQHHFQLHSTVASCFRPLIKLILHKFEPRNPRAPNNTAGIQKTRYIPTTYSWSAAANTTPDKIEFRHRWTAIPTGVTHPCAATTLTATRIPD